MTQSHKRTVGDAISELKGIETRDEVYKILNAALEKNPHIGENAVDKHGLTPYMRAVLHKYPSISVAEWLEDSTEHRAHGRKWHKTSPGLEKPDKTWTTALVYAVKFPDTGEEKVTDDTKVRRQFIDRILARRFPEDRIRNNSDSEELAAARRMAIEHRNHYFARLCKEKFKSVTAGMYLECQYAIYSYQPNELEEISKNNRLYTAGITKAIVIGTLNAYATKDLSLEQAKNLLNIAKKSYSCFKQDEPAHLENMEHLCFQFPELAPHEHTESAHIFENTTAIYARSMLTNAIKNSSIDTNRMRIIVETLFPYLNLSLVAWTYQESARAEFWDTFFLAVIPFFNTLKAINELTDKFMHDVSHAEEYIKKEQKPEDVFGYFCTAIQKLENHPLCGGIKPYLTAIRAVRTRSLKIETLSEETTDALSGIFSKYAQDLPSDHTYYLTTLVGWLVKKEKANARHFGSDSLVKTLFTTAPASGQQEEHKATPHKTPVI